jgi:hypothetical protein
MERVADPSRGDVRHHHRDKGDPDAERKVVPVQPTRVDGDERARHVPQREDGVVHPELRPDHRLGRRAPTRHVRHEGGRVQDRVQRDGEVGRGRASPVVGKGVAAPREEQEAVDKVEEH